MDFLNKSIAQVSELFRSMTPGARLTAGLLLAVVVVSIGYLFQHGAAGPDAYLFGGEPLPDGQLNRVEAAIAQAGLSGYEREGNRIRVPAGQQAAYLAAVADAGALPPNFNTILENALDKGGPWESASSHRERLKIAKQQTLSRNRAGHALGRDAVVLYDEQQIASREQSQREQAMSPPRSTCSRSSANRSTRVAPQDLQKLVAHAVDMQAEDVTVTNLGDGGDRLHRRGASTRTCSTDEYYQTKVTFEMQKRDSIMNALPRHPGRARRSQRRARRHVEENRPRA